MMYSGNDYIIGLWDILDSASDWNIRALNMNQNITLPPVCSTQIAFFILSTQRFPATVEIICEGGTCRKPGPSLRGFKEFDWTGISSEETCSPGRTRVRSNAIAITVSRPLAARKSVDRDMWKSFEPHTDWASER